MLGNISLLSTISLKPWLCHIMLFRFLFHHLASKKSRDAFAQVREIVKKIGDEQIEKYIQESKDEDRNPFLTGNPDKCQNDWSVVNFYRLEELKHKNEHFHKLISLEETILEQAMSAYLSNRFNEIFAIDGEGPNRLTYLTRIILIKHLTND